MINKKYIITASFFILAAFSAKAQELCSSYSLCPDLYIINAAEKSDVNSLTFLLNQGYPVDIQNNYGETPMAAAAKNNKINSIKVLLNYGADYNQIDYYGNAPICYAHMYDAKDAYKWLAQNGADTNIFCYNQNGQYYLPEVAGNYSINSEDIVEDGSVFNTNNVLIGGAVVAAAGGAALAIGSGGGGGSGDSSGATGETGSSEPETIILAAAPLSGDPTTYQTAEYDRLGALSHIKASSAYARGYTGYWVNRDSPPDNAPLSISTQKIKVAVVDTGVDVDHPNLAANITSNLDGTNITDTGAHDEPFDYCADGYTYNLGAEDCYHGTFVSGIIAGVKNDGYMHGVAYNSEIVPFRINYAVDGIEAMIKAFTRTTSTAYGYAGKGAFVANNSWSVNDDSKNAGSSVAELTTYFTNNLVEDATTNITNLVNLTVANDNIIVFAAGNDGNPQPSAIAALPKVYEALIGHFISVVSVEYNAGSYQLASYSNACGDTKAWCLGAMGSNVTSTIPYSAAPDPVVTPSGVNVVLNNTEYYGTNGGGTSYAAPQVTAAAAILKGAFPYLSAEEIVTVLLETADDLGAAGVDNTFGHGLLNLNRATTPQGEVQVVFNTNLSVPGFSLPSSFIQTSAVFGKMLKDVSQMAVFDKYNRAFTIDNPNFNIKNYKVFDMVDRYNNFATDSNVYKNHINDNWSFSFSSSDINTSDMKDKIKTINLIYAEDNIETKTVYQNQLGLACALIENADNILQNSAVKQPFMDVADNGFATEVKTQFADNSAFIISAFSGDVIGEVKNEQQEDQGKLSGTSIAAMFGDDNNNLRLETGFMTETKTFLGSKWSGAFAIDDDTPTSFMGVRGNINLFDDFKLFGQYYIGKSSPKNVRNSIVKDFTGIYSDSYSLGTEYDFDEDKKLGFIFSQPLRVFKGKAGIDIPISRDDSGNVIYEHKKVNMASDKTEYNFQGYFDYDILKNMTFTFGFGYIMNPYNTSNDNEFVGLGKFKFKF